MIKIDNTNGQGPGTVTMPRQPTKRACIDIGHKCNINCIHCYHKHEVNRDSKSFISKAEIFAEAGKAYYRGCNYIDFTGGETTLCDWLPSAIAKIKSKFNMRSCIITNALCGPNTLQKFIDAGTDDFLVSLHGMEKTFDAFTGRIGARQAQIRTLDLLPTFRANYCITKQTENDITAFTKWILGYQGKVRIVNFINFNPSYGWADNKETEEIIANLHYTSHQLQLAIDILEHEGIGVNVRYFPMCMVADHQRKNICNTLHVTFDPYEWDYGIDPKTTEAHLEWAFNASSRSEMKQQPCKYCKLQWICGGVNNEFYRFAGEKCVSIATEFNGDPFDSYYYRKENKLCLALR